MFEDITCKECNEVFSESQSVRRHVKKHGMTYERYVLKWKYADVIPKCKCGCDKETEWNIAYRDYAQHILGHHMNGRTRSEETRRKIGKKNAVNMACYMQTNPHIAIKRGKQMLAGRTPKVEAARIAATKNTYACMSIDDKKKFSDHAKNLWSNSREKMDAAHKKATQTWEEGYKSGRITINGDAVSKTITQKYLDGGFQWSRGNYVSSKTGDTIWYRSSWELMFARLLDSDQTVLSWKHEPFSIQYENTAGKIRRYIPDFYITRISGKCELVEVKPQSLRLTETNMRKRAAAEAWCTENACEYREWKPE